MFSEQRKSVALPSQGAVSTAPMPVAEACMRGLAYLNDKDDPKGGATYQGFTLDAKHPTPGQVMPPSRVISLLITPPPPSKKRSSLDKLQLTPSTTEATSDAGSTGVHRCPGMCLGYSTSASLKTGASPRVMTCTDAVAWETKALLSGVVVTTDS